MESEMKIEREIVRNFPPLIHASCSVLNVWVEQFQTFFHSSDSESIDVKIMDRVVPNETYEKSSVNKFESIWHLKFQILMWEMAMKKVDKKAEFQWVGKMNGKDCLHCDDLLNRSAMWDLILQKKHEIYTLDDDAADVRCNESRGLIYSVCIEENLSVSTFQSFSALSPTYLNQLRKRFAKTFPL